MIHLFFVLIIGFSNLSFSAEDKATEPQISVGKAKAKKTILAYPAILLKGSPIPTASKTIQETITNDLIFVDLFKFLDVSSFIEKPETAQLSLLQTKMADWKSIGADFLIKSELGSEGKTVFYEVHLIDVAGSKEVFAKKFVGLQEEIKIIAHTAANEIVQALTGSPGMFLTKISMVCDRTGKKEIYVMDFDGSNVKQVTQHRSIAISPSWSPDNDKLVYSVYTRNKKNIRNLDLYEYSFKSQSVKMLSNRKGINSGAVYSPDGTKIALTMSFLGNPEIFVLEPQANTVSRLTNSFGFDVDPAWAPDGKKLAFVSSRSGMPMIFSMNANGDNVQRLTFAGRYNSSPTYDNQGKKIAFAGWIDGRFDIFVMNADGTKIDRLTKNQGNNEDPQYSPDGTMIGFSSNRTGQANIYIMDTSGMTVKRLTYGLGRCITPKFSNILKR